MSIINGPRPRDQRLVTKVFFAYDPILHDRHDYDPAAMWRGSADVTTMLLLARGTKEFVSHRRKLAAVLLPAIKLCHATLPSAIPSAKEAVEYVAAAANSMLTSMNTQGWELKLADINEAAIDWHLQPNCWAVGNVISQYACLCTYGLARSDVSTEFSPLSSLPAFKAARENLYFPYLGMTRLQQHDTAACADLRRVLPSPNFV